MNIYPDIYMKSLLQLLPFQISCRNLLPVLFHGKSEILDSEISKISLVSSKSQENFGKKTRFLSPLDHLMTTKPAKIFYTSATMYVGRTPLCGVFTNPRHLLHHHHLHLLLLYVSNHFFRC